MALQLAIESIVYGKHTIPYLISGPPGIFLHIPSAWRFGLIGCGHGRDGEDEDDSGRCPVPPFHYSPFAAD